MKRSLLVLILVLLKFTISAQTGELDVIDAHWTNYIEHSEPASVKKLSSPTATDQPFFKMTIRGDRELYEHWVESKEIPLRFVWFAESRVVVKRKSLKVSSGFNFKDPESLSPIISQLDSSDQFTIDIWSRSFRRLREGEVRTSLVYKNNRPVRKCESGECTFNILIEKQ